MSSFGELMSAATAVVGDNAKPPAEIKSIIEQGDVLVLDVQDPGSEFALPGAVNISLGTLPFKADQDMPDFHEPSLALRDKAKNVVVTCAIGGQAMLAGKLLIDYGFKNTYVTAGGNKAYKDACGV